MKLYQYRFTKAQRPQQDAIMRDSYAVSPLAIHTFTETEAILFSRIESFKASFLLQVTQNSRLLDIILDISNEGARSIRLDHSPVARSRNLGLSIVARDFDLHDTPLNFAMRDLGWSWTMTTPNRIGLSFALLHFGSV